MPPSLVSTSVPAESQNISRESACGVVPPEFGECSDVNWLPAASVASPRNRPPCPPTYTSAGFVRSVAMEK